MNVRKSGIAYWDQDNPDRWLTDNRIYALKSGLGLNDALPSATIFRTNRRVVGNHQMMHDLTEWLTSKNIGMLIVDTLSSISPGAERDPSEAVATIGENFFPMVDLGITPLILHHIGKDILDTRGGSRRRTGIHAPRGTSALVAAVGAAFNLDRDGDTRRLECVKPRYGLAPTLQIDYDEDGHMGSEDWKVTITCPLKRVSQDFVTQFATEHGLQTASSRKLVSMLRDRGYTVSQSTAARALSRVK